MPLSSPDRFYYLNNFLILLGSLRQRYGDLLDVKEREFIGQFAHLSQSSQALLVRMLMRKGVLFRASKLRYEEIPEVESAVVPLRALGWIDDAPLLSFEDAFALLRKDEIARRFALGARAAQMRKADMYQELVPHHAGSRVFDAWRAAAAAVDVVCDERVYHVTVAELCECLTLLFFGNFRQDLTEFILADLGVFRYETVELGRDARAFDSREQIDSFFQLFRCRQALHRWREQALGDTNALAAIVQSLPPAVREREWLESRRQRLRFEVAREYERLAATASALDIYRDCTDPRAAARLQRIADRELKRRVRRPPCVIPTIDMTMPLPDPVQRVEYAVLDELTELAGGAAPVHYVENVLVNSLFGLLCWRAIFAPVAGAFFHPFHHGPADLTSVAFHQRRAAVFAECFEELQQGTYRDTILTTYRVKHGIASPFVFWGAIDDELLCLALDCIPPAHLQVWFDWILRDIPNNRAGFPDLIQFWPTERRYALIEVKGPGDRLQDNQRRCLEHCLAHGVPLSVVRVQWSINAASAAA